MFPGIKNIHIQNRLAFFKVGIKVIPQIMHFNVEHLFSGIVEFNLGESYFIFGMMVFKLIIKDQPVLGKEALSPENKLTITVYDVKDDRIILYTAS